MIGRQISRYRIVEQIGSGGMSVVYKGLDTSLDREVAVKVLHPHLAERIESRRRFSREAKAVARLHHPNILEIYDFSGDDADDAFIVTEYIRGKTLRTFAEEQRFDPPEIAALAVHELAGALEHAHATGVIHRDLKPENVMIRDDGVIKLMDFGIAKVLDRDERMTMTGALVGSPAHMAPEIIEGQESGREADIFSLGTILYWLCCGRLPFLGNNTTQTLKLILDGTYPDPRLLNPAVSDALAGIIARCLHRDPSERFAHAGELRDALGEMLQACGIDRPAEELTAFFADPPDYRERLRKRLAMLLLERAEEFCRQKRDARALDCLNRVLALDPDLERAQELIERMNRRKKRVRRLARLGWAAGLLLLIGGAGAGASILLADDEQEMPTPTADEVTALAAEFAGFDDFDDLESSQPLAEEPTEPAVEEPPIEPDPAVAAEPAVPASAKVEPIRPVSQRKETREPVKVAAVAPTPRFGPVSIKVHPYAPISIDGEVVNPDKPYFEGKLPVGRHLVKIANACCTEWQREIEVTESGHPPIVVKLDPKPALMKVVSPDDVHVMVAGVYRGTSAASEVDPIAVPLPEGSYRGRVSVRLYQEGFVDEQIEEEFVAGSLTTIRVELARK